MEKNIESMEKFVGVLDQFFITEEVKTEQDAIKNVVAMFDTPEEMATCFVHATINLVDLIRANMALFFGKSVDLEEAFSSVRTTVVDSLKIAKGEITKAELMDDIIEKLTTVLKSADKTDDFKIGGYL